MSFTRRVFTRLKGDRIIWLIVALLSLISLLVVYSSTGTLAYKYQNGNTEYYFLKHLFLLVAGWFLMYIAHTRQHLTFQRIAPFLLIISIILLIFTLIFGGMINGASRWLTLPLIGYSFQASDFAKIGLILYVARIVSAKQEVIKDFKQAFIPIIAPVGIVCVLIAPANLSTALVLFVTCMIMMFVGRINAKTIFLLGIVGIGLFGGLIVVGKAFPKQVRVDTWISRSNDFLNNSEGAYQVQQAKIAIAKGGKLWGLGPGNSEQRNYLPEPYSDFIYAIIIEEYGLLGGFVMIFLYLLLFFRIVRMVTLAPKAFGAIAAVGLGVLVTIQALANMAVSVHMVPVTGQTLPLVSMGGNSVLFTCVALGIIQSIGKYIDAAKDEAD